MGACETTPPTAQPRGHRRPPTPPTPPTPPRTSSSPPMIGCRSPASSSFVLAAARLRALQLDPGPTRQPEPRQLSGRATKQSPPARQPHASHRARTPRLLTARVPMGAKTCPRRSIPGEYGAQLGALVAPTLSGATPRYSSKRDAGVSHVTEIAWPRCIRLCRATAGNPGVLCHAPPEGPVLSAGSSPRPRGHTSCTHRPPARSRAS
jgi:hypothetical protein